MKKIFKKIKLFGISALIILASFFGVQSCGVNVAAPKIATVSASAETVTPTQVSDLTGTTWEFNITISNYDSGVYNINFSSNEQQFTYIQYTDIGTDGAIYYNSTRVYVNEFPPYSWIDGAYRTITITGGTDATNATLIAWLENNATLINGGEPTIDDLTGTAWVLNQTLTLPLYGNYHIDFDPLLNSEIPTDGFYNLLTLEDGYGVIYSIEAETIPGYIVYSQTVYYIDDEELFPFIGWGNQRNRLLVIYGGADATNATLIAWLEANGERIDDNDEFLLGYNYGYDNGYAYGFVIGSEEGDEIGYQRGLREGQEAAGGIGQSIWDNMFVFVRNFFDALIDVLSVELVPNVNIGLVTVGVPMVIWAVGAIIRLVMFFFGGA